MTEFELRRLVRLQQKVYATYDQIDGLTSQLEMAAAMSAEGGQTPSLSDVEGRLSQVREEYGPLLEDYSSLWERVDAALQAVEDDDDRLLLQRRYTLGYTWPDIAEAMGCSVRDCRQLHRRALASVEVLA